MDKRCSTCEMNEKPDIQHCQWCRDVLRSEYEALEQQAETLKAMMRKKDEAIIALYGALIDNFCHEDSCPFLKDDPNRCETCSCMPARMSAVEALSLTPASVAKEVEDARVGRAVEEWRQIAKLPSWLTIADGYKMALNDLAEVVAKAREGLWDYEMEGPRTKRSDNR